MPTRPSRQTGTVWPHRITPSNIRAGSTACTLDAPIRLIPSRHTPSANPPPGGSKPTVRRVERRGMAGVTLIELIMTVAIAAILLTLAAPSFTSLMNKNRVASLTNELSGALHLARSEAVKRGKTVTVCKSDNVTNASPTCSASANWQDGWLIFVDDNQDGDFDTGETRLKVGQPTSGNAITVGTDFTNFISYFPAGTSNATGAESARTFSICIAPEQRRIVVSRIGQIRITPGTCS